jgi:hypothetical protein
MNCEAVGMCLQAGAVLNAETSDFLFNVGFFLFLRLKMKFDVSAFNTAPACRHIGFPFFLQLKRKSDVSAGWSCIEC